MTFRYPDNLCPGCNPSWCPKHKLDKALDGFGHVSARHDKDPSYFLLARSMAPALVTAADIMEFDLDGNPIDLRGRTAYPERFIHSEIYKTHPEVRAVVHSHSPAVIPFGVVGVALRPTDDVAIELGIGLRQVTELVRRYQDDFEWNSIPIGKLKLRSKRRRG